ncbi:hypothetical protein [Desulfosediminicola sp.]|uniref:hypothetical protein n=1 Tax=Desulfosediminicola sp. TaxID=2886825 RepID=UPI003AF2A1E2
MRVIAIEPKNHSAIYVVADVKEKNITYVSHGEISPATDESRTNEMRCISRQVRELVKTHSADELLIKASSVSRGMGAGHLGTAEVRGICVGASDIPAELIQPESMAKGKKRDSLKNDKLFEDNGLGDILKKSREAGLLIIKKANS